MTHVIYGNCINLHAISLYVHWAFFFFLFTTYCQMLATHTFTHTRIILANRKTSSTMFCNILDNHLKQIRLRLLPNNEIINSTLCHFACYPKPYSTVSKHSQTKGCSPHITPLILSTVRSIYYATTQDVTSYKRDFTKMKIKTSLLNYTLGQTSSYSKHRAYGCSGGNNKLDTDVSISAAL